MAKKIVGLKIGASRLKPPRLRERLREVVQLRGLAASGSV